MDKRLARVSSVFIVIGAVLLAYWPALSNDFVWDDHALILRDPLIRSWHLIPEGFRHYLFLDVAPSELYRPIQRLSYTMDYHFSERNPRGYHLTSIYLHIAASGALLWMLSCLFPKLPLVWRSGITVLWAIHPLHTGAVAYVAGRAESLAALFGFLSLALTAGACRKARSAVVKSACAVFCMLVAILSHEAAFACIAISGVLVWYHQHVNAQLLPWRWWAAWGSGAALILCVTLGMRMSAIQWSPPPAKKPALATQATTIARSAAIYAGLAVAPISLQMERRFPLSHREGDIPETQATAIMQGLAGATLAALVACGLFFPRHPQSSDARIALTAFVVTCIPVAAEIAHTGTLLEQRFYTPLAFLFAWVGLIAHTLWRNRRPSAVAFTAIALILVVAWGGWLGIRTWKRLPDWKDAETVQRLRCIDELSTAKMNLDAAMQATRVAAGTEAEADAMAKLESARKRLQMAIADAPEENMARANIVAASLKLGDFTTARRLLEPLLRDPFMASGAHLQRAALEQMEHGADPLPFYEEAVRIAPHRWPIRRAWVMALNRAGETTRAVAKLRIFLAEQPFRSESWRMLAEIYEQLHDHHASAIAFREAIHRDEHDSESVARLGIIERTYPEVRLQSR